MNKETIKALDAVLEKIDALLASRSNIIYKTDLNELRNFVSDLQESK